MEGKDLRYLGAWGLGFGFWGVIVKYGFFVDYFFGVL